MNLELFIANRILSGKGENKSISKPIVKIAIIGIIVGLCVMILSIAIVTGFKKEITNKVTGFGSDIQITNYDNNSSYETSPISIKGNIKEDILEIEGVKNVQIFATKPGIIKTKKEIQGIILHGVGKDFESDFIENSLIEGEFFSYKEDKASKYIVISQNTANILKLKLGEKLTIWFIQQPARARRFVVSGIYNTGLQEFDNMFAFCDVKHIQKLNNWNENQYSGLEVSLERIEDIDIISPQVVKISSKYSKENNILRTRNIKSKYPFIFDWLDLLDMNVWIILILMVSVAGFNMVSSLLILILERTNMIGVLKALGQKDYSIRKVFLYLSARLIFSGLLWGNLIGISICLIQKYAKIIKLDPVSYYLDTVPINIDITHILLLNFGTMLITVVMLIIPSMLIAKISPVKAISFE